MKKMVILTLALCFCFSAVSFADNEIDVYSDLKQSGEAITIVDLNGIYAFTTPDTITYAIRASKITQVINSLQAKIDQYNDILADWEGCTVLGKLYLCDNIFNPDNYKYRKANETLKYYRYQTTLYVDGDRYDIYNGESKESFVEVIDYTKWQAQIEQWTQIKERWETFEADCEASINP